MASTKPHSMAANGRCAPSGARDLRRSVSRWLFALAAATLVLFSTASARAQFVNWRNISTSTSARAVSVKAPRVQLLHGRGGMFASSIWVVDDKFNILAFSPWAYWNVSFDDAITNRRLASVYVAGPETLACGATCCSCDDGAGASVCSFCFAMTRRAARATRLW